MESSMGGFYSCAITPLAGQWNVTISLVKEGYQDQTISFTMNVEMIPVVLSADYPLNRTITGYPGDNLEFRLQFLAGDTGQILTSAIVRFIMVSTDDGENTLVSHGTFQETDGVYFSALSLPEPGLYIMNITIDKESFAAASFEVVINSEEDPSLAFVLLVQSGILGALSLFGILSIVFVSRALYQWQTSKWRLELLSLQGRLEDSRNLIGLLVIHNEAGLPIYSNIIKGGFQESMVSSFITAITHFRSEFTWDGPIYTALPISDVITAVQTKSLICAIITLEGATESQKRKLENFGVAVSNEIDEDTMSEMITELDVFAAAFDPLFEEYFDGRLIKRYIGFTDTIAYEHLSSLMLIESEFNKEKGASVDELIKVLIRSGYSERRALRIVLDSIDDGILIPYVEDSLETL
jgi:hypothetical protein